MTPGSERGAAAGFGFLAFAVVVAACARIPGAAWGENFPGGFRGHHVDEWTHVVNAEILIDPKSPPRWKPNPYPMGLAAHVAVPIVARQAALGRDFGAAPDSRRRVVPPDRTLILAGRAWSIAYGVLTVVVLYFAARRITGSELAARFAALFLALGGLHVSQSHFFVADVPALFWTLLGAHLMIVDCDERGRRPLALPIAAFALGCAFGLKLALTSLPALAVVALLFPRRLVRTLQTAAFFIAGFAVVTFVSMSPPQLLKILAAGINSGAAYAAKDVLRIYAIELVASTGAPVLIFALLGAGAALRGILSPRGMARSATIALVVVIPCALHAVAMVRKLDPFPRHALTFFPWIALLAGLALAHAAERLASRPALRIGLVAAVFAWQVALVVDGERRYVFEPRNDAMAWILANVPEGSTVSWPAYEQNVRQSGRVSELYFDQGRPEFVVAEMYALNHYVSGTGWRESYPTDPRSVFDVRSPARMEAHQALHRGAAGYVETARFSEGYVMPEFRLAESLLGNRSRNYLTEVVIYRRR